MLIIMIFCTRKSTGAIVVAVKGKEEIEVAIVVDPAAALVVVVQMKKNIVFVKLE